MTFTRLISTATAALLLSLAAPLHSQASDLKVTEMAVTTKIVKGNPIDAVWRISSSSVKSLYCFTRTLGPEGVDTTIKHTWFLNDEVVHEDVMPVKGKRWRTYSMIPVKKGTSGQYRCQVQDAAGEVLKSVSFRMN